MSTEDFKTLIISLEFWALAAAPIITSLIFGLNAVIPGESKKRHVIAVCAGLLFVIALTVAFTVGGFSAGVLALVLSLIISGFTYRVIDF